MVKLRPPTSSESIGSPAPLAPSAASLTKPIAPWLRPFVSFLVPGYRAYFAGMFLVFASMQMQMVTRSWFMYNLTKSPLMLAVLGIANGLPMVTFSLFGGALADRITKKYILMAALVGMAGSSLMVALLISSGAATSSILATLLLASVGQAVCMAFMMPARQAILPELVGKARLLNAIALNSAEMNATRMIAPAVAGMLIARFSVAPVFFLMSAMVFVSFVIITLFLPKTKPVARTTRTSMVSDMGETFTYLGKNPVLRDLMIIAFVTVIFGMPFQLLLPIFTEDVLHVGPEGLGVLMSLMGVGALVGSIAMAAMGDFKKKGMLMLVVTAVFALGIIAFTAAPNYGVAMAVMIPLGFGSTGRMTMNNTLIQIYVDNRMRARVMGLYMMEMGMQPLGSVPIAAMAGIVGAPIAVGAGGAIVGLFALWAWVFRPAIRKLA